MDWGEVYPAKALEEINLSQSKFGQEGGSEIWQPVALKEQI